jgi:DNA-binding transcriptional MerR regulator
VNGDNVKIGKFAENNELSIDTIRHYMDLGLVVPEKQGGQYYFDEKCQKALNELIDLKSMGFSLNEVKTIFLFRSLGKLTPYQEDEYYKSFFSNKHKNVEEEICKLSEIKLKLEEKMQELSKEVSKNKYKIGINIKTLDIFRCLKCQGQLMLSDGNITNNEIIDGKLSCNCGEEYLIKSGILMVENSHIEEQFKGNYDYIREYINFTDTEFLSNIYRGLQWIESKVDFTSFSNKVLLELGTGMGIFLRYVYDKLPEDSLYIAVDHDINRHHLVKNMLEMSDCRRNIIFICSDFLKVPIKEKSIDVLIDYSGTTNYSFQSSDFLLELVDGYVKDKSSLLGAYILFKNFSINSLIEEKYRKNFTIKNIKEGISKLKYSCIHDRTSDYIDKGGKYENFFIKGEKVYSYIVNAER